MPAEPFARPAWLAHGALVPLGGTYFHVQDNNSRGVTLTHQGRAFEVSCDALFDAPWEPRGNGGDYFPQPLDLPSNVENALGLLTDVLPLTVTIEYAIPVPVGTEVQVRFRRDHSGWYEVITHSQGALQLNRIPDSDLRVIRPHWFYVGARISMRCDIREHLIVESIDDETFRAFKADRPTAGFRYRTSEVLRDWTPTTDPNFFLENMNRSLEPRRRTQVRQHGLPNAEFEEGSFVTPRGSFFVFKILTLNYETASYTVQRVRSVTDPVPLNNRIEDLPFDVARKSWAGTGVVFEALCSKCSEVGRREAQVEGQSQFPIRAYRCPKGHAWTVYRGGYFDGQPTPASRFDRDPV